ncbi:PQ-loop repeat-containing protein [Aspergillus novofumigatus IBT 16806]|uniref:PQ loop repeat protein n=1 Tax=Aspergillus novofumigatus (strain IBT 16806) TaxID=1392255 RepID=A0A2I1C0W8_ASPN1|nr:uncharacterized protein P174DRAFT_454101 [Aspergillus novofumigatus IBT 16806]PKX91287.1 hypothetical protein P174DRAFT_454101 [Aspergillus novofumigatus IBT 16806]
MLLTILSLIVLLLTFASFTPQIQHVWRRRDAKGISSSYILLNLICATEHVFFGFFYIVNMREWSGFWTHHPINILDWVNFVQLTGVWAFFNVLFFLSLYFKPTSRLQKALLIAIYIFFLIISLVPLVIDATIDIFCPQKSQTAPIIVMLLVLGLYKQARASTFNLSLPGLKLQAVVFMLSAASWVLRLAFPWKAYLEQPQGHVPIYLVIPAWWQIIGFVAVDDAIFALGQGVLLWLALRRGKRLAASHPESRPLLGE